MQNMSLPFLQLALLKRSFKCHAQGKGPLISVKSTFTLLFWHKILIPNFKRYCHEGLCMSQHTGSHKNSLTLLGEKYMNESQWPMHRIRLLEYRAYFIELPSTFKMHSFIRKTSLFPFILVQETASSCWLIQVYIQCRNVSSCKYFRHQKNRNWNSVHHCIKSWQKMQKLITHVYATLTVLFCNVSKTYSSYIYSK